MLRTPGTERRRRRSVFALRVGRLEPYGYICVCTLLFLRALTARGNAIAAPTLLLVAV